jgi:hypothetical protein
MTHYKEPSWPDLIHIAESISSPRRKSGSSLKGEEMKLDSGFRRNDDENTVMAGLDPAISGQRQMRGSSPRMTH